MAVNTYEPHRPTRRPRSTDPGITKKDTNLEDKVRTIIADVLCMDEEEITMKGDFVKDYEGDFLDQVEIVMALEEKFKISITETVGEKIISLETAIKAVSDTKK